MRDSHRSWVVYKYNNNVIVSFYVVLNLLRLLFIRQLLLKGLEVFVEVVCLSATTRTVHDDDSFGNDQRPSRT